MGTLVCFAVKEEATAFRRLVAGRGDVSIIVSGMGSRNAENAVHTFLADNKPALVLTCGFAGGLDPSLTPGAVVFETTQPHLAEKLSAAGAKPATSMCADHVAVTAVEKCQLRKDLGVDFVEMESGTIQTMCLGTGIPCATVRVISDTANENLPLDFNQLYRPDMSLDFGKLMWTIAKSPGKIAALMRLQKRCRFAAEQLAAVLVKVV
jgi:adenosylhomocysteine nucleosidase